jgi:hypothetical protein
LQIGEAETVGTADLDCMVVTLNKTLGQTKSCSFLPLENCFLQNHTKKGIFRKIHRILTPLDKIQKLSLRHLGPRKHPLHVPSPERLVRGLAQNIPKVRRHCQIPPLIKLFI